MARSRSARRGVACERECVVEERERERAREGGSVYYLVMVVRVSCVLYVSTCACARRSE